MFHSVSLLSQAPFARGSRALPSVLFSIIKVLNNQFVTVGDARGLSQHPAFFMLQLFLILYNIFIYIYMVTKTYYKPHSIGVLGT